MKPIRPLVLLMATMDTKGVEAAFLKAELERRKLAVQVLDVSARPSCPRPGMAPGPAIAQAAERAQGQLKDLCETGAIAAVLAIGGGKGTALACQAMQGLPYALPKVLVSAGRPDMFGPAIGATNIWILPSLVDINGLNRFTRTVLGQAAAAIGGIIATSTDHEWAAGPQVALSSFGATAPAVTWCRQRLAESGLEVVPIPATGVGGRLMESLVRQRTFCVVLDLTTTELADELVGGFASAGADRLRAAGDVGIPQVVAPGAMDMVNFGAPGTVPEKFRNRHLLAHAAHTTLMRTTPEENLELGRIVGNSLTRATAPAALLIPCRGFSAYDCSGGEFYDPAATEAFITGAQTALRGTAVHYEVLDCHINDPQFAARFTEMGLQMRLADSKQEGE